MTKLCLFFLIVLLIACENSSNNITNNLSRVSVLLLSYDSKSLEEVRLFEEQMPNFDFNVYSINLKGIPSIDILDSCDVVIFFSSGIDVNELITDSVGNVLYQFVEHGGKLIQADFHANDEAYFDYGDIELISPVVTKDISKFAFPDSLIVEDKHHIILNGIDTLFALYGGGSDSVRVGSNLLASWNNGDVLVASYKGVGHILYISLYPAELQYDTALRLEKNEVSLESFFRLWANAIRFIHSGIVLEKDLEYLKPDFSIVDMPGKN